MSKHVATVRVALDEKPELVEYGPSVVPVPTGTSPLGDRVLPVASEVTPSQVANPARATLRTVVAVLVGLLVALPTINTALLALQGYLSEQTAVVLPSWVWLVVNGAVAVVTLVSGVVTRLLAVPGVNAWIVEHLPGLSAIPSKQVPVEPNPDGSYRVGSIE